MVEYSELPELPGVKMFRCERLRATLAVESCAKMWRGGNRESVERLERCKACPTGAVHAGDTAASMSPMMGMMICARCHRGSTRLIGKALCVSCWNRQREFILGKNSKGTRPTKMLPLERRRIRYMSGPDAINLTLDHSRDTMELVVTALRDSKKRVTFAFLGQPKGPLTQMRLF